mmetsp:Transcript_13901/g.19006  ORF Transcript_13901/g.19006 Transcript_13901/m.19006 type:complete len:238 (-) Transcript_13901:34-747(-)
MILVAKLTDLSTSGIPIIVIMSFFISTVAKISSMPLSIPSRICQSIVICGPSGVGKGTVISNLIGAHPTKLGLSVSHTTRKPRNGEVDGLHYHFVSNDEFESDLKSGKQKYLEHAIVHANMYGTRLDSVEAVHRSGKLCILDLDTQGVAQLKQCNFPVKSIFLMPPSLQELEERLRQRKTESEEQIRIRIQNAEAQITYGTQPGHFDVVIENKELLRTVDIVLGHLKLWFPENFMNV